MKPKEKKEKWVYENGEMCRYESDGCVSTRPLTPEEIEKKLDSNTKRVKKAPMGVSQWRNHGKKYGYWEYFEKRVKKESVEETLNKAISIFKKQPENEIFTKNPIILELRVLKDTLLEAIK